jgi:hypothetical protein
MRIKLRVYLRASLRNGLLIKSFMVVLSLLATISPLSCFQNNYVEGSQWQNKCNAFNSRPVYPNIPKHIE